MKIEEYESGKDKTLHIPLRDDGKEFDPDDLYGDQQLIVAEIMSKIKEWLEADDLSTFKPMRMTINGSGGSGKSVVINTVVTLLRKMFQCNDVIRVVAPTGTAAFNVKGETFHHLLGEKVKPSSYTPNTMNSEKRKKLVKKFKTLLALIIDERSLASSKSLGTTERMISETVFEGGHLREQSWGGVPIVILVGDDYQLPSTEDGALTALTKKGGNKMVQIGRAAMLECAECVMNLKGSKRMQKSQKKEKALINRLRKTKELSEAQTKKLLSLHLSSMKERMGATYTDEIEKKAVFLFYTNEKRTKHNLKQLIKTTGPTNPVAILKPQSFGNVNGKADRRHFDNKPPSATLIAVGSKVALYNKNFCPLWGLHNGAGGTVEELVFAKGTNPNNGDLPKYVVVNFPLYCGPAWDTNSPKVSKADISLPDDHSYPNNKITCRVFPFPSLNSDAIEVTVIIHVASGYSCHCVWHMPGQFTSFRV